MKIETLVFGFALGLSQFAFGAELNLNGGESATIQANVLTQVTCGGGSSGNNCVEAANGLKKVLDTCTRSYTPGDCVEKHWPRYKKENPTCKYAGLDTCLAFCTRSYTPGDCTDTYCD